MTQSVDSISIRLQRTTIEAAHISVPITAEVLKADGSDPSLLKLDVEKLFQIAVGLGNERSTKWLMEGEPVVTPHQFRSRPRRLNDKRTDLSVAD